MNVAANRDAQRIIEEFLPDRDLADRFRQQLIKTFSYILQHPGGFQIRYQNYRYAPLDVFKYHVIYSYRGKMITVHRIRHMRQEQIRRYSGR